MSVEWNNCLLCLKDLGKNGGKRGRRVEGVDENSRIILVLNYLLGTKLSRKEHSNGTLDSLIRLLSDAAPPTSPERKRKGGSSNPGIRICESCEMDVVLVAELHQQLEVIQMRLVDVLKGLRRKVVECSGTKGNNVKGNPLEQFENWLGTQKEMDVREQKRILEEIKGFQNVVVANVNNFVDIPRVFLDNLSIYRGPGPVQLVPTNESLQIESEPYIKTEKPEIENDIMMDFDAPLSPVSADSDYSSHIAAEARPKVTPKKKPRLAKSKTVNRRKKKKCPIVIKPEVKDEVDTTRRIRSSSFVASARISSLVKPRKYTPTSKEEKKKDLSHVPKAFTLESHCIPGTTLGKRIERRYVCRTCSYSNRSIYKFENHLRIHEEELSTPPLSTQDGALDDPQLTSAVTTCQECQKTFRCQQYYEFHMAGHFGSHEISCDVCSKKCSPFEIEEHLKTHCDKVFPCPNCSVCYSSRQKYLEHLKKHTSPEGRHHCDLCEKVFKQRRKLLGHYGEAHPGTLEKFVCDFEGCEKEFMSLEQVQEHQKCHTDREHLCKVCNKVLSTAKSLKLHVMIHENVKPCKCPHCPQAFVVKANLDRHLISHHGGQKFKCDMCGKEYMDNRSLERHLRLHYGTGLTCDQCGKMFMTQKLLERHIISRHTDEKPVVCKICGARFKDKGWIRNHMKIHEGDRRWKCQHCDKAFVLEDYLIQHLRIHTGEKSFVCDTCGKGFNQYAGLFLHRKRCK